GARNVLVDERGRAFVTDFGLGPGSIEEDEAAFAALEQAQPPRRRGRLLLLLPVAVLAGVLVLVLAGRGAGAARVPPLPAGAQPLGSALSGGGVRSVDCEGQRPSGSSLGCTLLQIQLPDHELVAPSDGVIRDWVVRGAKGDLALQVLRGDATGRFEVVDG